MPNPTRGSDVQSLRVLIASEKHQRVGLLALVVIGLGHDVIAREIAVTEVAAATTKEHPDVALVELGLNSEHALALISEIVREASCPVIAILHAEDPAYIYEAAKRGVFAYIVGGNPGELQSAIDITLQRFSEYQNLQGAFGRRATIEQAKGILMARHSITADKAFQRLRRPPAAFRFHRRSPNCLSGTRRLRSRADSQAPRTSFSRRKLVHRSITETSAGADLRRRSRQVCRNSAGTTCATSPHRC